MKNYLAAFIALLLVAVSSGGRANREQEECFSSKCDDAEDAMFKKGQAYTYIYQGESKIHTAIGSYGNTGLLVKSKIVVTGLSNCQMKLKMTEVEMFDRNSEAEDKFVQTPFSGKAKEVLEENEILFTRQNNEVKSICVNKNEPVWSQNMKKSIVDMLANQGEEYNPVVTKKTRHGTCLVIKTESDEDATKTISYDVTSCKSSSGKSLFTDLSQAVVFGVSNVNCKYAYANKDDLKTVHCSENYDTTSLREKGNNINVNVISRLERIKSKGLDMTYPKKDLVASDIQMKEYIVEESGEYPKKTKETLKLLCEQHLLAKKSDIPKTFMTLVNDLKKLTSSQVKAIYVEVLKTDVCPGQNEDIRSMFYDAIGFVNTPAATSVMVDLIKTKQISEMDQVVWFTSLSFMQTTPTLDMIKELESLLQTTEFSKQMYLGISAVTHLYCKDDTNCLMEPTVRRILTFFLTNLGQDCTTSKTVEDVSRTQISLKSLENLKLFNEDVVTILSKCATTKSNPTDVRVSALDVMKHMDCSKDRSGAMEILQNNENDSEMRIHGYLTIMGCPDINTMFRVREILSKEKVNQVGSFIWTHLTNIRESDDILKKEIQKMLNDVDLKNEFDISKLKFSRNIEKTFSMDKLQMTFDSNVIFSEKSFIPRSLSINTTAVVLNRPTNFIEMSARMEGLDNLLFKLLGPEGYLKKRSKQNTADDNVALVKLLEEVSGNLNIKLFGQQISFVELIRGSLSSVKKYNILEELMNLGQEKSIQFQKSLVLLDKVATIPTSLGFPLKFTVQGSAAVTLKMKSKIDIAGLVSWPISVNIENDISPSIMSEFSSEIAIETPFSNYGMSVRMKSGTDTEFKATVSAGKNEEFTIKFDTPKNKQEIVTVSGKSFVVYREMEVEQLVNNVQKYELCSPDNVKRLLGIKICGNVELADRETRKTALFYGPFSANIYIEKEDTQTGYLFKGLFKKEPYIAKDGLVYNSRFLRLELDSPNSRVYQRKFALDMALDYSENMMKVQFDTPWTRPVKLMTTFKLSDKEKRVLLLFVVGNENVVKLGMKHASHVTKSGEIEEGVATFEIRNLQPFETNWKYVGKRDKWTVKFESKGLFKEKTNMKIEVHEVKSVRKLSLFNQYKLSGSYETFFGKGKISGVASQDYYGHRWDVKLDHRSRANPMKKFIVMFRHKTEDKSSKSLLKYFLTSTISYGESAENAFKFELENELSARHIRASIKTNLDETKEDGVKRSTEMNLQLYGGYTWKEDNRHYAEGSLSFKLPTKGVNYEGRYNSEVGKGVFKMAIVLDKDQQSKVNFKINYLQPKLYLKDTDCDVTFSLPNHNMKLDLMLKEVDVNKYEYAVKGKYNSHVMKIEGKQTEISKLKYDSSLKLTMPVSRYLPEKVNVDLRVDFVDLKKSSLSGKFEIPDTDNKYSLDLKLSSIPQNFLQLPMSENNSVFRYQLELGNAVRKIKSESVFTCNPEEVQVYFNLAWNADKYRDEKVAFDLHTIHKSPNYKQYDSSALIAVYYPGNSHSVAFKSQFKYTELEAQIDMAWNRNQKMSVMVMYEVDNSWTQKGAKAMIILKTPFPGLELTQLGINAVGQLRYRKVDIEFKWAGNRKILFDIVVQPRSSSDFTLTSKLVTPFKGMSLISVETKHLRTVNSILSSIGLEFSPTRRYSIKFEGINNSEGKNRDIASNLVIESGVFLPFKVSFTHKDDKIHFESQFDATWMKSQSMNIKSKFSYTFGNNELITNGNVELLSTIEDIKQMKATWSMENTENTFINNVQILYKSNNIFQNSIKGFIEREETSYKMEFNGFIRIMSGQPLKVTNSLRFDRPFSFVNTFSVMHDNVQSYSHSISIKENNVLIKMFVLNTEFKTAEYKSSIKYELSTKSSEHSLKIGELYFFKEIFKMTAYRYPEGKHVDDMELEFYSDYIPQRTVTVKSKITRLRGTIVITAEATSQSSVLFTSKIEYSNEPSKNLMAFFIKSNWERLRLAEFSLETVADDAGKIVNKLTLNINDAVKAKSIVKIRNVQLIDIDFKVKYKHFSRHLKLKHERNLMGYDHLLDTNLFGANLKIMSSTESRGGSAIHSTLKCNLPFLKSLDIVGKFSKSERKLDIIYQYPTTSHSNEIVKLTYHKTNSLYLFNIDSKTILSTSLKLDLVEFKSLNFEFRTLENLPKIDIKLNYDGGLSAVKHTSEIKFGFGGENFVLRNKIAKRNGMFMLVESNLKTNRLEIDYKLGARDASVKVSFDKRSVSLTAVLPTPSNFVLAFKVETTFEILREMVFEMKHKQNEDLSNVVHSCLISFKSGDKVFRTQHNFQWNGTEYIKIDLSVIARTSKDKYVIKPKSLTFVHQFYGAATLKEKFEIFISESIQLKANVEIPLVTNSNSVFIIESSVPMIRKLRMDVSVDLWNRHQQRLAINVERNEERVLTVEHKVTRSTDKMSVFMKVDVMNVHVVEIAYEGKISGVEQLEVRARCSWLEEDIKAKFTYDKSNKEGAIAITGKSQETFSLSGKISRNTWVITFKYGKLLVHCDLTLAENMFRMMSELRLDKVMKLDVQVSPKSSELSLVVNENVVKVQRILSDEFSLDINVLSTAVVLKLKALSKNPYKYELSGTTNLRKWSSVFGELYFLNDLSNQELTTRFSKEDSDIYNLIVRNTKKSFNVKLETVFDVVKSGVLNVVYDIDTKTVSLNFDAETFDKKTIKAVFGLKEDAIEGRISSSFEWINNVEVKGALSRKKDQIGGSFSVIHNMLEEPLKGEISVSWSDFISWDLKMTTPFAKPFNKIRLTKKREYKKVTLELRDEENRIFKGVVDFDNESKSRLYVDVNIPERFSDFKITLDTLVNIQSVPYFALVTLKSNLFEEVSIKTTCDPIKNSYGISFSHPSKEGSMKLDISKSKIAMTSDYDGRKTSVDITYDMKSSKNFNGKINFLSNIFGPSATNFNFAWTHNIDLPQELTFKQQTEWNGRIVLLADFLWKTSGARSFDLKSKLALRPYNKEYTSSFELSKKEDREFVLLISPMGDSKVNDINVKFNNKMGEKRLNINTPYDVIRAIDLVILDDQSSDVSKQTITFSSNYLGKYNLSSENKWSPDGILTGSAYFNSPNKNGNIQIKIEANRVYDISLKVDEDSCKMVLSINPEQLEMKMESTFPLIKRIEVLLLQDQESFKIIAKYNEQNVKVGMGYNSRKFEILLDTNTLYAKDFSFYFLRKKMQSVTLQLKNDMKTLKLGLNFLDNTWKCELENDLLQFVPKKLHGTFKYVGPLNLLIELNKDSQSIFKVLVKRNEFVINVKTTSSEVKIGISDRKLELIVVSSKMFSILVDRKLAEEIDVAMMINDTPYQCSMTYRNNAQKFAFSTKIYKNSLEKLFEVSVDVSKVEREFDIELNMLTKQVLKLKFSDKRGRTRKIMTEIRYLFFTAIFDVDSSYEKGMIDYKFFWNVKVDDNQLTHGSVIYALKIDFPRQLSLNLNFATAAYQIQFSEIPGSKYHLKISSPFKEMDLDLLVLLEYNPETKNLQYTSKFKNEILGEYYMLFNGTLLRDVQLKFRLETNRPIIDVSCKVLTSSPNDYTMTFRVDLLTLGKIELLTKLDTKNKVKLIISLKTPFRLLKKIYVEKTLWVSSALEHRFETIMEYKGIMSTKYVGGHKISLLRGIITFNGLLQHDKINVFSLKVEGSKNSDGVNHLVLFDIQEKRYGYKVQAKMNPLLEGKTEIYTPFHHAGVLVLQGRQIRDGIKIQAGKDREEMASFEYMSRDDVKFMKVTPPAVFGKPMAVKYQVRRYRRSVGEELQADVKYGNENLLKFDSKTNWEKEKNAVVFKISSPMLSTKSAELKLMHKYEPNLLRFNHHLKIKDSEESLYKIIGDLFHKDRQNFKYDFSVHHPYSGPLHFKLGHILGTNTGKSHFSIKNDNKLFISHDGFVRFELKKIDGEWVLQIPNRHIRLLASHSGDLDEFKQRFSAFYNTEPLITYKADIAAEKKSVVKIEVPISNGLKLDIILDRQNRKAGITVSTTESEYGLEIVDKDGEFSAIIKSSKKKIASLALGYTTKPQFVHTTIGQHSIRVEATLKDSVIVIKSETTFRVLKTATLRVTKNKLMINGDYNDELVAFSLEYHFVPNNFFLVMETSSKQLSKVAIYVTPSEIKVNVNEYYQLLRFVLNWDHLMLVGENNFYSVKTVKLNANLDKSASTVNCKLEIDEFVSEIAVKYSDDKILLDVSNNGFFPRSLQLELSRQSRNNRHLCVARLTVDKMEAVKLLGQISDTLYAVELVTNLQTRLVVSLDLEKSELIVSSMRGERYLNLIGRVQIKTTEVSKTFVMDVSVDSSSVYLQKLATKVSYSTTKNDVTVLFSGRYNQQQVTAKGKLTKTHVFLSLGLNNDIYSGSLTLSSPKELVSLFTTPRNKLIVAIKNENNKYTLDVKYNEEELKAQLSQTVDDSRQLKHSSQVWYRGNNIWAFDFSTNFQSYDIKMKKPLEVEVYLTNEWKSKRGRTVSFWTKYMIGGETFERGLGVTFNVAPSSELMEVYIENNKHVIKLSKWDSEVFDMELTASLLNKVTKNQWVIATKILQNEKFEVHTEFPEGKRSIKFNKFIKNDVVHLSLEASDIMKLVLKSDDKSVSLIGTLSLFGKQVANIEVKGDNVKVSINPDGSESKRITLEWTKTIRGEWMKDYKASRRLIVKQKALKIDIDFEHQLKVETYVFEMVTKCRYSKIDGSVETMHIGATADFSKPDTVTVEFKNPIMALKTVIQRRQLDKSSLRYDMTAVVNENDQISGYLEVSVGQNFGYTSKLYYNPKEREDFLQIHAKYLDDRQVEVRIFAERKKTTTNYFQLLVRLLNENKIETIFKLRRDTLKELKNKIRSVKNALNDRVKEYLESKTAWIEEELALRYRPLMDTIPNSKVIKVQLRVLVRNVKKEVDSLIKEVYLIINNNEFYFRDISYTCAGVVYGMYYSVSDTCRYIWWMVRSVNWNTVIIIPGKVFHVISRPLTRLLSHMSYLLERAVINTIDYCFPRLFKSVIIDMEHVLNFVRDSAVSLRSKLYELRRFRQLIVLEQAYYVTVKATEMLKYVFGFIKTSSLDFLSNENEIKVWYENAVNRLQRLSSGIKEKFEGVFSRVDETTYMVFGEKYCSKLKEILSNVFEYLISQLKDDGNRKMVNTFVTSSFANSFGIINQKIHSLTNSLIIPRYFQVNRQYGDIDSVDYNFMIISPIPLNDIKSIPDFSYVTKKVEEVKGIAELIKRIVRERVLSGQRLLELLRWFTPQLPVGSLSSFVPDFESYATILGSSVMTFDKKSLELRPDNCKVTLVKDVRFKKWEVVLEQNKDGRTYTVNIGPDKVSISMKDNKIYLNQKVAELPFSVGSAKIMAFGSVVQVKDDILGLKITVDPVNDMLTVGISGWYHGQVRGLFGNADNEPFNDMMDNGERILMSKDFFQTYSNGGTVCKISKDVAVESEENKSCPFLRKLVCNFLYRCPLSPMAACFGKVDPRRFLGICTHGSQELSSKLDKSVCRSARSYQVQCANAGVIIQVPFPCRKCDLEGGNTISINEHRNEKTKEKVADIVIVVDEGKCLKNIHTQVNSIITKIDANMKDRGITDVRYGLVAFRGDGVNEAHTHTLNQKVFGSRDELLASLKSLKSTDQDIKDTTGAITLASTYPFRGHASKHLILINCGQCEESYSRFNTLNELLEKQAIRFSTLMDYDFQVKEGKSKKMIYGVDSKSTFTRLSKRGEIAADVIRPDNDCCYKLAMKTYGVAFNINYLIVKNEATQKSFIDTFATQVTVSAIPARTTKCRCDDDGEYNCVPLETYAIFPTTKT